MIGVFVGWVLFPFAVVGCLFAADAVPKEGSGALAASLVLVGFFIGKATNEAIARRFPRNDSWWY